MQDHTESNETQSQTESNDNQIEHDVSDSTFSPAEEDKDSAIEHDENDDNKKSEQGAANTHSLDRFFLRMY